MRGSSTPDHRAILSGARKGGATRQNLTSVLLGLALLWVAPVSAQRRDGGAGDAPVEVALTAPVRFGEQLVGARRYRLSIGDGKLAFADPGTMVTAATVSVVETAGTEWVSPAKVELKKKGAAVELVVKVGDRIYTATGTAADGASAQGYDVMLAKRDASIDLGAEPAQASDRELVQKALERYGQDVKRCGEKAQKGGWVTDDPRFVKCVCPLVDKWRMPKLTADLLMHYQLVKGRSGLSFLVATDGKVKSCRVWVGTAPPPEDTTPIAVPQPAPAEAARP
jgi:hypothetical protein